MINNIKYSWYPPAGCTRGNVSIQNFISDISKYSIDIKNIPNGLFYYNAKYARQIKELVYLTKNTTYNQ